MRAITNDSINAFVQGINFKKANMRKDIVILCPNGIAKFYYSDGTRNLEHPESFYRPEDIEKLKKDFTVKYA